MAIKLLSPHVANQIAAGEVIERPSSVVKELVENSLDAGSDSISINIEKGGSQLICIRDNGCGIKKDDLVLALQRYGTSKIRAIEDLEHVASLGFRGEALASIAAVSRLTLQSCMGDTIQAWQVYVEGIAEAPELKPVAHPVGTTIEIHDLFFNMPARRKFLRADKTEFQHIENVCKQIALSNFSLQITLTHNQRTLWTLNKAKNDIAKEQRLAKICNKNFVEHALAIDFEATGLHLWGWVAEASWRRNQTDMQYLYVNGRSVRDKIINHAIRQAYQDSLSRNEQPAYVLFFELEPALVDVNVHPTKREVRFREQRLVHDFIFKSLYQSLQQKIYPVQEGLLSPAENKPENTSISFAVDTKHISAQEQQDRFARIPSFKSGQIYPTKKLFAGQVHDELTTYNKLKPKQEQFEETPVALKKASAHVENSHKVLAIIHNVFILLQNEDGLCFIDICEARKQLINAQLSAALTTGTVVSQPLLIPETIRLVTINVDLFSEIAHVFKRLGFIIGILGPKELVVRQAPKVLTDICWQSLFACIAEKLASFVKLNEEQMVTQLRRLIAECVAKTAPRNFEPYKAEALLSALNDAYSDIAKLSCTRELSLTELRHIIFDGKGTRGESQSMGE